MNAFPMGDDMQSRLQAYCAYAFPARQGIQVRDLVNITAGWESELYSFAVEYGSATERQREGLILRIYSGDAAHTKSAHEFRSMSRLHKAGYPVPRVQILERENSPFGKPFVIMERIDGQMMWRLLSDSSERRQEELLALFCDLFVRLHALEWRPLADDAGRYSTGDQHTFVDRWLRTARDSLKRFPMIDFLPAVEWLEKRRDELPCLRPSPVHQDYHPANVLLRDDGSAVVIDWTGFDVSDSRFDLAWTLVLAHAYSGAEMRNRILREYERLAGVRVGQMECFEVFACLRRLFDLSVSLLDGAERRGMRPGAVTLMKQQGGAHKRVYDLLLERTGIRITAVERLFASLS